MRCILWGRKALDLFYSQPRIDPGKSGERRGIPKVLRGRASSQRQVLRNSVPGIYLHKGINMIIIPTCTCRSCCWCSGSCASCTWTTLSRTSAACFAASTSSSRFLSHNWSVWSVCYRWTQQCSAVFPQRKWLVRAETVMHENVPGGRGGGGSLGRDTETYNAALRFPEVLATPQLSIRTKSKVRFAVCPSAGEHVYVPASPPLLHSFAPSLHIIMVYTVYHTQVN